MEEAMKRGKNVRYKTVARPPRNVGPVAAVAVACHRAPASVERRSFDSARAPRRRTSFRVGVSVHISALLFL